MLRSIVVSDDSLFYDRGGENRTKLDPLGNDLYRMADVPVLVNVRFEPSGETPQAMVVEQEGEKPLRLEKFERVAPGTEELLAYAGSYYSDELDYVQNLKIDGDVIVADRRGGAESVQPLQRDTFIMNDGVVLMFERNEMQEVIGFRLQAGRVRNLKFVRQ
jgi:hypothetical protein